MLMWRSDDQGATGIVEMLFTTSLVALVGSAESQASNSPRKLQIVNTKVTAPFQLSEGGHAMADKSTAPVYHLRAHLPDFCPQRQDQSEAIGGRFGE